MILIGNLMGELRSLALDEYKVQHQEKSFSPSNLGFSEKQVLNTKKKTNTVPFESISSSQKQLIEILPRKLRKVVSKDCESEKGDPCWPFVPLRV